MQTDGQERRRAPRYVPHPLSPIARVRLRTGRELTVIDRSRLGVLVEGPTRLLPGTHLDVYVTSAQGWIPVRARVVRWHVWNLTAEAVQYRGAFAFGALVELDPLPAFREPSRFVVVSGFPGRLQRATRRRQPDRSGVSDCLSLTWFRASPALVPGQCEGRRYGRLLSPRGGRPPVSQPAAASRPCSPGSVHVVGRAPGTRRRRPTDRAWPPTPTGA